LIHINGAPHPLRRADRRFPRYLCASAPRRFACRDNAGHEDGYFLCELLSPEQYPDRCSHESRKPDQRKPQK